MAISQHDFWKLLVQSKLFTDDQCRQCIEKFSKVDMPDESAKAAAEWLVRQKLISKYQASVLLAGRPGPFVFGSYKIFEKIEGGRFQKTFRAVHAGTHHIVLLKLLSGPATENAAQLREMARWLPVTSHPNLTRCYEVVDQGKNKFVVMQDLRGETLAEVLKRVKQIPTDEACRLVRAAAIGLSRLHDQRIVHGDIRPHNFWLEPDKNLKLVVEPDIGTRTFNSSTAPSEPDGLVRADYAAPEFTQSGRVPDPLTDIYALGCTLYEFISGQPPFRGGDVQQKLKRHATEPIQPLDKFEVPTQLVQRIAYMMAKNPAVRYQSAQIVADQLAQFCPTAISAVRAGVEAKGEAAFESWLEQKVPSVATSAPEQTVSTPPVKMASSVSDEQLKFPPALGDVPLVDTSKKSKGVPLAVSEDRGTTFVPEPSALPSIAVKRRGKTRRSTNLFALLASIFLLVVATGLGVFLWQNPSLWKRPTTVSPEPEENAPAKAIATKLEQPNVSQEATVEPANTQETVKPVSSIARSGSQNVSMTLVDDDGQSLWSSPTDGSPIALNYVPPGAQLLFFARPAEILAGPEGQRVIKALGPEFEAARASWESAAGVKLEEVDRLIIALYANPGEFPRTAFVVELKSDVEPDQLAAKWGATALDGHPGISQKGETAYFVPSDNKRTFVMGPYVGSPGTELEFAL